MVYKRDGQIQEFRPEKIENAVLKAFYDVEKEETEYAKSRAKEIAENISALDKDMEVEEIQDIVESQLAKKDMKVEKHVTLEENVMKITPKEINKCKTILCDVDEVINNLVEKILVEYNKQYNDSLTLNDITDWEVKKFIKPECENIFTEFGTDEFLSSLELLPKAKEVIGKLMAKYNFYFVTSTYPDHVRVKDEWLKRNIPQYDSGMLVVCRDKHLVHGDILIDDCIGNFTLDHTKDSPVKYNFIFDKPWNRSVQEDNTKNFRVHGWDEIYELIDKLEDF